MKLRLVDASGTPIALEHRLGRGGEGEVYAIAGSPHLVAKLLYPKSRTQNKFDKLRAMVARPPAGAYDVVDAFPVLTWPRSLLFEEAGRIRGKRPIGYTMARIQERDFMPFYRITSSGRRRELGGAPLTWDRLVVLGIRLCHVVRTLHRLDYAVGDMNDRNVLVSRRFTPLFMDTDSFQVPRPGGGHYPCMVGDQMYWPPEHLDVDYTTYRGSRVTGDRYALGVLLFQLFLNGHRPFQARGSQVEHLESLVDKTRAGYFPWSAPQPGRLEPPAGAPDYANLPRPVRALFEQCFVKGHHKPGKRPTADDWYRCLLRVREIGFQTCPRLAAHVYGKDQRECPWCRDPNNPFGMPAGWKPPRRPAPRPRHVPTPPVPKPATTKPQPKPIFARSAKPQQPKAAAAPVSRAKPKPSSPKSKAPVAAQAKRRGPAAKKEPSNVRPVLVRTVWVAAVLLVCATSTLALLAIPMIEAKQVALFALTTLWISGAFLALGWRRVRKRRTSAMVLAFVAVGGIASAGIAFAAGWQWLDYANAAMSLLLGIATFVVLERGQRLAFWPRPRGALHATAAIGASYAPAMLVWLTTRI